MPATFSALRSNVAARREIRRHRRVIARDFSGHASPVEGSPAGFGTEPTPEFRAIMGHQASRLI